MKRVVLLSLIIVWLLFLTAEDGIGVSLWSRGIEEVYKERTLLCTCKEIVVAIVHTCSPRVQGRGRYLGGVGGGRSQAAAVQGATSVRCM